MFPPLWLLFFLVSARGHPSLAVSDFAEGARRWWISRNGKKKKKIKRAASLQEHCLRYCFRVFELFALKGCLEERAYVFIECIISYPGVGMILARGILFFISWSIIFFHYFWIMLAMWCQVIFRKLYRVKLIELVVLTISESKMHPFNFFFKYLISLISMCCEKDW